ncbi:MAG: CHAP domain-containing protein [Candidatus Berkelbacteria bacterium]|nr:CHAP domain-containing protein [Candidatus Berkelbacteria bacterium]
MTFRQFIDKYKGQGIDEDGSFGFQCVDLVQQYSKEVLGIPRWGSGNAIGRWENYPKDKFERIANTPIGVPQNGDIVIWGKTIGEFGHIAVFIGGTAKTFQSFDQNFPLKSLCHIQSHNYKGVLGWLRLRVATPPPAPPPPPDPCAEVRGQLELMTARVNKAEQDLQIANNSADVYKRGAEGVQTQLINVSANYDTLKGKLDACTDNLAKAEGKIIIKPNKEMSGVEHILFGFGKLFRKETK